MPQSAVPVRIEYSEQGRNPQDRRPWWNVREGKALIAHLQADGRAQAMSATVALVGGRYTARRRARWTVESAP